MFRRRHVVPVCLAAALLLPELSGRISGAVPRPDNVLLITLDTMRADRLPAYGFTGVETPALDRIAAEGSRSTIGRAATFSASASRHPGRGDGPVIARVARWGAA